MATLITVTLTSGQSLGIATADLVYATNDGVDTILTIENYQTNPQQIRVTESLNAIVALDDSFLTVTTTDGKSYLLSGTRIKTCEDLTTFRQISYEGVGITNVTYKVTDTLAAVIAAVNSSGGGSSSRVIASLENVNLKDAGANVLTWASGKSAANTVNPHFVFKYVSGTYVDNVVPGVQGTASVSIDSGSDNIVQVFIGATQLGEIVPDFPLKEDFQAQVLDLFQMNNFTNVAFVGDVLSVSEPLGNEGLYEGQLISFVNGNVTTSLSEPFAGGTQGTSTLFNIELDGVSMIPLTSPATTLTIGATSAVIRTEITPIVNGISLPAYPTDGVWSVPVVRGAQDDFVIDIYLLGDTI